MRGTGGFGLAEHPFEPNHVHVAASIWKLCYTTWLQRSPAITVHHFCQGVNGLISKKPTTFLSLKLRSIHDYLHTYQGGEIKESLGTTPCKHQDDTFATSAAKEYPESLNKDIARAICDKQSSNVEHRQGYQPTQEVIAEAARHTKLCQQYDPFLLGELFCEAPPIGFPSQCTARAKLAL